MKKIFKLAETKPLENGSHTVTLDGRVLKTPAKAALELASLALAEAVAEEWNAQEEKIDPATMPMMTLASTAIDRVGTQMDHVAETISAYGGTDLLCYRADENQPDLHEKQVKQWQPWLDWAMTALDAPLTSTRGIMHVTQPEESLAALSRVVAQCNAFEMAALHEFTTMTGSLVLGLAVLREEISAADALEVSLLDELHQAELWGEDEEAAAAREKRQGDMANAEQFLKLARA
ncbi:ATP12 family chaperone protein [Aestuariispira insulae]|uniref:Chaperone required for assembly of F1-ATPase n=1 Tax=Aestuariispira insulae TaxID=1461337 RepID=A0A3D9HSN9_9PROT|nr:ATP12 family protein [Aestuariispira insulae]RED52514.1 chaperone required for assembly of F1-ATPase [Aestuariispira insulae]